MKRRSLTGVWNIQEMEMWDEDYFNMEVQAHVTINDDMSGSFQFGLVSGYFHGEMHDYPEIGERMEFTWEGNDECDEAFGFGWVRRNSVIGIEGEFRLHRGDSSTFTAIKKDTNESLRVYDIKKREERIAAIIQDQSLVVNSTTLRRYLDFLKENIRIPIKVKGIENYFTYSDYKGKTPHGYELFEIIEFEEDVENSSNLFVKVKRLSDEGGLFLLQLYEFKTTNTKTIEHQILKDYSIWIDENL